MKTQVEEEFPGVDAAAPESSDRAVLAGLPTGEGEAPRGTPVSPPADASDWPSLAQNAEALFLRSRPLLERMHAEDKEEATELIGRLTAALDTRDRTLLRETSEKLNELLFFVAGR